MTTHWEIEDHKQIIRDAKKEAEETGNPLQQMVSRNLRKYYKRKVAASQ